MVCIDTGSDTGLELSADDEVWFVEAVNYHQKGDNHLANNELKDAARCFRLYYECINRLPRRIGKLIDSMDISTYNFDKHLPKQ
jgi:hypothetical protein